MSEPWDMYQYTMALVDEENALGYRRGGYLCVHLGDELHDRYIVQHKLGQGSYATVWLAYDKHRHQYVSLKILRADQPQSRELDLYTHIRDVLHIDHLCSAKLVELVDHFEYQSDNGDEHQCLVFEVLGPTVYLETSQKVDADIYPEYGDADEIFTMTVRLLQGMSALHEAGYAWGDPSPKNFAYSFPSMGDVDEEQALNIVGPVEKTPLERLDGRPLEDGVPAYLVSSATFPDWPMEDYEDDFRILDLGSAFPVSERRKDHTQPTFMQPPERIFDREVGYETDAWGAGMMIYYFIFAKCPPFSAGNEADRIHNMIGYTECIPQRWCTKWETIRRQLELNKDKPDPVPGSVLRDQFENADHSPDVKALLPVIQDLMRMEPESRHSPKQALDAVLRICEDSEDPNLRDLVLGGHQDG